MFFDGSDSNYACGNDGYLGAFCEYDLPEDSLAKQMGNSAQMIEKHYSKLTASMAADRLA